MSFINVVQSEQRPSSAKTDQHRRRICKHPTEFRRLRPGNGECDCDCIFCAEYREGGRRRRNEKTARPEDKRRSDKGRAKVNKGDVPTVSHHEIRRGSLRVDGASRSRPDGVKDRKTECLPTRKGIKVKLTSRQRPKRTKRENIVTLLRPMHLFRMQCRPSVAVFHFLVLFPLRVLFLSSPPGSACSHMECSSHSLRLCFVVSPEKNPFYCHFYAVIKIKIGMRRPKIWHITTSFAQNHYKIYRDDFSLYRTTVFHYFYYSHSTWSSLRQLFTVVLSPFAGLLWGEVENFLAPIN